MNAGAQSFCDRGCQEKPPLVLGGDAGLGVGCTGDRPAKEARLLVFLLFLNVWRLFRKWRLAPRLHWTHFHDRFPCVHAGNYLLRQQQGFEAQWLTGTGRRRVGATQVVQKAKEDEAIRRRSIERVPCRSQLLFCMPSVVECCEC